jgi:SAM-dependent methyltransferase
MLIMSEAQSAVQILEAYRDARSVLNALIGGVELLGMVHGALACGLLQLARTPCTLEQIVVALRMDHERVIEFCNLLDAHGVFIKENGHYRLADKWVTLTAPDAIFPLGNILDGALARAKALQLAANAETDFWTLTSNDRIALAKSGSVDPSSPLSTTIMKSIYEENVPELHEILSAGGRILEFGCGLGGGLLSTLCAYPNTVGVGVDLADDLLDVARQRSAALGISDRVVFWQGDAQDFYEDHDFDYVWWSQFFFPPPSRAAALQAAFRALRAGGFLIAPVQGNPSIVVENLHSEAGQVFTRNRVIFGSWGIPAFSAEALKQEIETVGFISARLFATVFHPMIVARRP